MPTNKLLPALAVVAVLGGAAWFALSSREPASPTTSASAEADAAVAEAAAPSRPLAPIGAPDAAVDAAPPEADAALTMKDMEWGGVLGRPVEISLAYVESMPWWQRVEGTEAPTFENPRQVRVVWQVADGRVVGARATFPLMALSADVPPLGSMLIGGLNVLPGGPTMERIDENSPIDLEGEIELYGGGTYYWKAKLRNGLGDEPRGPEWFELRTTPFPPPSAQP